MWLLANSCHTANSELIRALVCLVALASAGALHGCPPSLRFSLQQSKQELWPFWRSRCFCGVLASPRDWPHARTPQKGAKPQGGELGGEKGVRDVPRVVSDAAVVGDDQVGLQRTEVLQVNFRVRQA